MSLIIIIAVIWSASALIHSAREKRAREQAQRIANEQARIKREMREMKQRANEEVAARIALEREQMRQAKEQERQAAQLEKHEKRLADLEFRMAQAESDIEFLNDRIAQLDAQRDYLLLQQSGTVPGGKEHTKYQTKIVSIESQIHTAENRLNKAQHTKAMAQREMEVA